MRQAMVFGSGLALGAALLFAAASFGLVGKAAPPSAGGEHGGEGGEKEGHEGHDEKGHGEAGHDEKGHEEKGHEEKGHEDEENIVELTAEALALSGIESAPARRMSISKTLAVPGEVSIPSGGLSHVGSRVEGVIHHVTADLGSPVKEGQVLAVLDSIPMGESKASYLKALAEHELALKTFAREQKLSTEGAARKDLIEAEAGLSKAAIERKLAKDRLLLLGLSEADVARVPEEKGEERAHISIVAPLAGVVIDRHATPGEYVKPDDKLFSIANLSTLWILASVLEKDIHDVRVGVTATARLTARPGVAVSGRVTYISPQVDPKTRTVHVRIEAANADGLLRPDMFAEVSLPLAECADALAVPASAIQRMDGKQAVFVTKDDRRFERRLVRVGIASDGLVEISHGVEEGERVVVRGAFLLKSELEKGAIGEGHTH